MKIVKKNSKKRRKRLRGEEKEEESSKKLMEFKNIFRSRIMSKISLMIAQSTKIISITYSEPIEMNMKMNY